MTTQSNDAAAALAAGNEALKAFATGEAMGDASMGKFFALVADQIGDGTREFADVGKLYVWRYELMNNVKRQLGREETPTPTGNSLSAQLTKAKTIAQLGVYERKRTGTIAVLRAVAVVPGCQWKYKALIVAANAIATTLDDEPEATDERLTDAAMEAIDNIEAKVKTTEAELLKLAKAFDKLCADEIHGAVLKRAYDKHHVDARATGHALAQLINAVKATEAAAALKG